VKASAWYSLPHIGGGVTGKRGESITPSAIGDYQTMGKLK